MTEDKKVSLNLSEAAYYLFFSILFFAKGIGLYDGQMPFKIALVAAGICWICKMVLTPYSRREMAAAAVLVLFSAAIYRISGEKGLLINVMLIVGMKNIPVRRLMKIGLTVWSLSFAGLFFLTSMQIIGSPFKVHMKGGGLILRWGMGYSHPNVLHVSYLVLCLLAGYVLSDRMKWRWLALMMAGNLYVFMYSVSYTGFIAVVFYLALCAYWMCRKKIGTTEKALIGGGAALCLLFSMLAPILLQGALFEKVNSLLNTRLRLSRYFLTHYPFSLFGRRLSEITTRALTMDNSYVFAYVTYGAVAFALLAAGYWIVIRRYCRKQMGAELCIILAVLAAGVTEPFLFNTSFKNLSLLFLGEQLFARGAGEQKEYAVCSRYDRTYEFAATGWKTAMARLKAFFTGGVIRIAVPVAAGCIAGLAVSLLVVHKPDRIVVPRSLSDLDETWSVELNLEDDQIKDTDTVYGSAEPGELWLGLTGKATELEYIRGLAAWSVWTAGVFLVITAGVYCCRIKDPSEGQRRING